MLPPVSKSFSDVLTEQRTRWPGLVRTKNTCSIETHESEHRVQSVLVVLRNEAKPTAFSSQGSISRLRNATIFSVRGPKYQAETCIKDMVFDQNSVTLSQDLPKADCSHLIAASKLSHLP